VNASIDDREPPADRDSAPPRLRVLEFIRPTTGGAARHVELLIRMIDRERFDVSVLTSDDPDSPFVERLESLGIPVTGLAIKRAFHPISDARALFRTWRLMRRDRFDLVHCHAAKAGLLGRLAGRVAGADTFLYTPHGFYFNYGIGLVKRWAHIFLERILGHLTSRIVATAPREGAQIVELNLIEPERVAIIPNAVDTRAFRPEPAPDGPADRSRLVIGMVGRMAPPKDPFTFLDAARQVLEPFPHARFVLVGDGELMRPARKHAGSLGIADSVDFLGYREDIRAVLETFDVNVLSSRWEGLPYALVEGMALGKVAVGPEISGCTDLIQHGKNGYLFPVGDAGTMARQLIKLLGDDELRERMGRAARDFVVERHSADLWIKRIEGLYLSSVKPEVCEAVLRGRPAEARS
jgi:glycosyltransferase involved in cell wall biosynthesis